MLTAVFRLYMMWAGEYFPWLRFIGRSELCGAGAISLLGLKLEVAQRNKRGWICERVRRRSQARRSQRRRHQRGAVGGGWSQLWLLFVFCLPDGV